MIRRKTLSFFVAVMLILSTFSMSFAATETEAVTTANSVSFTDVTDHWAGAAIGKWAGYGIINGFEGLFRPDDSITRGEMAIILDNMMDYQKSATNTFTDLSAGQFYTEAILKANAAGIIKGDGVIVRPTDKITKEEAAIMMSRAFAVPAATSTKAFLDASAVSDWAKGAVFGMEAKGFVSGFGGYFNPKANITRAEAVTMINNIVKAYYTTAGTYTDNVNGTAVIKVTGVTLKNATITGNLIVAEGVGQGDAYLDSVTIKGDTVIRGGGENSIHITGKSSITSIKIEKIGDKIRVVVAEGSTVTEVEVAVGEDIILSGNIGALEVTAPGAVVEAAGAVITTATITGDNSTIKVGANTTINTLKVESTADNTKIETVAGATIKSVTAAGDIAVSGTGTVTSVTLSAGADGSKITTPNTATTVGTGVTGVTGGGGTAIPAGSTGTNNSTGTGSTVEGTTPAAGGGGGGGTPGGSTVNDPDFGVTTLTYNGSAVTKSGEVYQVPVGALADPGTGAIGVVVAGSGFDANKVYSMTVTVERTSPSPETQTRTITNIAGGLMNQTFTDTYTNLGDLFDYYTNTLSTITSGTPVASLKPYLSTQLATYQFTVTFTYSTDSGATSGQLDGGEFQFVLIP